MKKTIVMLWAGFILLGLGQAVFAGEEEKGSMKGSGYDHPALPKADKAGLQDIMKNYILSESDKGSGVFEIKVPVSGETRKLTFIGLHEDIKVKNGKHYSCADFEDVDTGEIFDVDIFVDVAGEGVQVSEAVVHKIDGDVVDGSLVEEKGSGY